jgi:glucose/arabinose dehydrogenase
MKSSIKILIVLITIVVVSWLIIYVSKRNVEAPQDSIVQPLATSTPIVSDEPVNLEVEIVAQNLSIPWDIAFLPNDGMLVTERGGRLVHIKKDNSIESITIDGIKKAGESGLLGITLHPKFSENHFLYVYITHAEGSGLINKVERYRYENGKLLDKKLIIGNIPGALYHDGGRMEFGPDGYLYITTGDATKEQLAQDKNSLAGKILRLTDDGGIPESNPFKTAIYSMGHRNPQGLAWDAAGNLWSTEHGRSGVLSGYDEINLIKAGANYGWPTLEGNKTAAGFEKPALHSGSDTTWAPASALIVGDSLFFGGLRGEALFEAKIQDGKVVDLKKHFFKQYGRIRTVRLGLDGMLYLTTSNKDDRGSVKPGDDKILRVNPARFK